MTAPGRDPTRDEPGPEPTISPPQRPSQVSTEVAEALDIARRLAEAGVPFFVARPNPLAATGFTLPDRWQHTVPDPAVVDSWRPGWALCMVCGHGLDLIDVDPRNGGDLAALDGICPDIYARASTPSGGEHFFIRSLGVGSRDNVLDGIDIKAGTDGGDGRGFAFIAPTVRPSKVTGELVAYRWRAPPSIDALAEEGPDDTTGADLAELVRKARGEGDAGRSAVQGEALFAAPGLFDSGPWSNIPGELAQGRHRAVHRLASALRGRGGWRTDDAALLLDACVWPLIDQQQGGHPYPRAEFLADIADVFERYPDGHDGGSDDGSDAVDAAVAAEVDRLRVRAAARRLFAAEQRGPVALPELVTLRQRLADPRPEPPQRIDGWQPAGGRVMLAAQYKAGKTTLNANLVRSLVDDEPFLGAATVHPVTGTITVLDLEMSERQLEHWFASLGIVNDDRVAIVSLRGRASSLNILDDDVRTQWAERLAGTGYLILDPLRPLLDALGLDEHHDAGTLLQAFDALLAEAGIGDALITHHMGHGPERSRGDSRLRDWPDVEWTLVRQGDDPRSPRYLSAYGRDVDQPETLLGYEPDTRRLSIAGGTRKQAAGRAALADVCDLIADGSGDWSGRRIEEEVCSATEHTRQAVREGIALGVREGDLIVHEGPRRAKFYTSSAPVRRSAP